MKQILSRTPRFQGAKVCIVPDQAGVSPAPAITSTDGLSRVSKQWNYGELLKTRRE